MSASLGKKVALWGLLLPLLLGGWPQAFALWDLSASEWSIRLYRAVVPRIAAASPTVIVVDVGRGWPTSYRWSPAERERRCLALVDAAEQVLKAGALSLGFDLLVGWDVQGRPNTCTPRTVRERKAWQALLREHGRRIVLPVDVVWPKFVAPSFLSTAPSLVRPDTETRWFAPSDRPSIVCLEPDASLRGSRASRGVVSVFAERAELRRYVRSFVMPQTQPKGCRRLEAFGPEIARLARESRALRGISKKASRDMGPRADEGGWLPIPWWKGEPSLWSLPSARQPTNAMRRRLRHAAVLFGAVSEPMREDIFDTPLGLTPGVLVHAHIVKAELLKSSLRYSTWWEAFLLLGLVFWLCLWLGWRGGVSLLCGLGFLAVGQWALAVIGYNLWNWVPPHAWILVCTTGGIALGRWCWTRMTSDILLQLRDQLFQDATSLREAKPTTLSIDHTTREDLGWLEGYPGPLQQAAYAYASSTLVMKRCEALLRLVRVTVGCVESLVRESTFSGTTEGAGSKVQHLLCLPASSGFPEFWAVLPEDFLSSWQVVPFSSCLPSVAWARWSARSMSQPSMLPAEQQLRCENTASFVRRLERLDMLLRDIQMWSVSRFRTPLSLYEQDALLREAWDLVRWWLVEHLAALAAWRWCTSFRPTRALDTSEQNHLNPWHTVLSPIWVKLEEITTEERMPRTIPLSYWSVLEFGVNS